ncbi:Peptidase S74 domain-containing protein [Flavobacterium longum]
MQAQQFPHVAASNGDAERVANFRVNDEANDFLEITNSTQDPNKFIPSIYAHQQSDTRYVLRHFATTTSAFDSGTIPLMIFRSEIRNNINLGAPNGVSTFPWGASGNNVVNRPLFGWENGDTQLMRIMANGFIGIGTTTPTALFHTRGTVRFENIPTSTANQYVLTADANGNVSRQLTTSIGGSGGINSTCTTLNRLPKSTSSGDLTCSQLFDNGTSVGIGTFSNFTYNTSGLATTTTGYTTGTLKLSIAGVVRGNVFISTSDEGYKENIKPIEGALEKITKLDGKTYTWNKNDNPQMNFDEGDHSGFIAQQVKSVLPHLVYTEVNDEKGDEGKMSVNYIELIPYLVEAIKEQQAKIDALQIQVNGGVAKQNQALVKYENTKIVSVSPNPSSDVVQVSFSIEPSVQSAELQVFDLNGKMMGSLNIKERGSNLTKSFQKDNFGAGIYVVSLAIDGAHIDSKKIVFK